MLLLIVSVVSAAVSSGTKTVGGVLGNTWGKLAGIKSFYERYQMIVDFFIFFLLFLSLSMLALTKWYGQNSQPIKGVSIAIGLALAFAALRASLSVSFFIPFVKNVLFYVMFIVVFLILKKLLEGWSVFWVLLIALFVTWAMFNITDIVLDPSEKWKMDFFGSASSRYREKESVVEDYQNKMNAVLNDVKGQCDLLISPQHMNQTTKKLLWKGQATTFTIRADIVQDCKDFNATNQKDALRRLVNIVTFFDNAKKDCEHIKKEGKKFDSPWCDAIELFHHHFSNKYKEYKDNEKKYIQNEGSLIELGADPGVSSQKLNSPVVSLEPKADTLVCSITNPSEYLGSEEGVTYTFEVRVCDENLKPVEAFDDENWCEEVAVENDEGKGVILLDDIWDAYYSMVDENEPNPVAYVYCRATASHQKAIDGTSEGYSMHELSPDPKYGDTGPSKADQDAVKKGGKSSSNGKGSSLKTESGSTTTGVQVPFSTTSSQTDPQKKYDELLRNFYAAKVVESPDRKDKMLSLLYEIGKARKSLYDSERKKLDAKYRQQISLDISDDGKRKLLAQYKKELDTLVVNFNWDIDEIVSAYNNVLVSPTVESQVV